MDDLSKEELEQLLGVFRDQSLQILEDMDQELLTLESGGVTDEAMARLRRAAHTIKGDSACIGLDGVTEVAHQLEDVFDAILNRQMQFGSGVVDLILDSLDAMRAAIGGEEVDDLTPEIAQHLTEGIRSAIVAEEVEAPLLTARSKSSVVTRTEDDCDIKQQDVLRRRDYVRVDAAKIDALLNLAGEMVIARSVINQIGPRLEEALPKSDLTDKFGSSSAQMGKLIAELQKSVLKMRMVTIDQVFRRFARPMRELAAESGKQVELSISGSETELDRALVDLLYEPILHLLRNAVDHGLETREERLALGKPEVGRISMRAYHEGNQVVVEIADDGRGINAEMLRQKAMKAGQISEADALQMPEEEALELLFLEGLSTAKEVTLVSGRGVGAAAVKSAMEHLRGSVAVKSQQGVGTTFVLRMPLTLAIIRALLFTANGKLLALPLLTISEIARAQTSEVTLLDGVENYRLRDRFISIVRPGVVLGFERRSLSSSGAGLRAGGQRFFIIIVSIGNRKYGVVADTLIGEQELVIKPLDSRWVQNEAMAGAAVLGDGQVVLIMDAETLLRRAIRYERAQGQGRVTNAG
ncbi:MAG TPA: chemotaxis protein CheA [Blastocatellia bacterium]|nr:chemotaxis protein CheA [Blastocatellia bacterium]